MAYQHSRIKAYIIRLFLVPILLLAPLCFANAAGSASVQSLSPGSSVSVGTPVFFTVSASGFTSPTYTITDSLGGSSVSGSNINSSGNFNWTPTSGDVGSHTITIAVNDSSGDAATTTEAITVTSPASLSIQSLSPGSSVNSGTAVSFTAAASGFTNPTYSVSDSFSGGTLSNSDINSSGNFNWTPATNDAGSHNITVTASDSLGHSASANLTITVSSATSLSIQSLSPGNVVDTGQDVSFAAVSSGFSSPTFSVSDSFSGTSVTSSNISSSGDFNWTPTTSDPGTHNIVITVTDSSGHTATASLTITVDGSGVSIESVIPGNTIAYGNPLSFIVSPTGFTSPTYTVSDSFSGSSVSSSDINSSGDFNWTPTSSDVGVHTISVDVTDSSGHNTTVTEQITVETPQITIQSLSPSTFVDSGTALSFVVFPSGLVSPLYTLSDTFPGTSLTNSDINSSGDFDWTPAASDVGSHTITITAADSLGHSETASVTITVSSSGQSQPQTTSTTTAQSYTFTNDLSEGSTGSDVTALQELLTRLGFYSGPVTGYYGSLTAAAVESFQTSHSISAVGNVGPETMSALNQSEESTSSSGSASGCAAGALYSTTTGAPCAEATTTAPAGCLPGDEYSTTTGQACPATSSSPAAATTSGYQFEQRLDIGSQGTEVTELQERLTADGLYSGPVTGYFGSLTQSAVESYQAKYDLEQVGSVGPETRALLNQGL